MRYLHNAHLKVNHKIRCPFRDCNFESGVYSTFKAHKSKLHKLKTGRASSQKLLVQVYGGDDDNGTDYGAVCPIIPIPPLEIMAVYYVSIRVSLSLLCTTHLHCSIGFGDSLFLASESCESCYVSPNA